MFEPPKLAAAIIGALRRANNIAHGLDTLSMKWPTILIARINAQGGPCRRHRTQPRPPIPHIRNRAQPPVKVKKAFGFGKPGAATMVAPAHNKETTEQA